MEVGNKTYTVVGKKANKTRWDACIEVAQLVRRPTIQISSLMKGMSKEDIEAFYTKAKTYSDPAINFWVLWKEFKPQ